MIPRRPPAECLRHAMRDGHNGVQHSRKYPSGPPKNLLFGDHSTMNDPALAKEPRMRSKENEWLRKNFWNCAAS